MEPVGKRSSLRVISQSKSLQRLKGSARTVKNSEAQKSSAGKSEYVNKILFDTPEKSKSKIIIKKKQILQDLPIFSLAEPADKTPFPSKISIFPKKQLSRLIQNNRKSEKKINPHLFTPILSKKRIEESRNTPIARSLTPGSPKPAQDEVFHDFPVLELDQSPNITETQSNPDVFQPVANNLFFYNKFAQPSFGGDEEPIFLSGRLTNECESDQSLKLMLERQEIFADLSGIQSNSEYLESVSVRETDRCDNETQTDEIAIDMLKYLDDNEIKMGIEFISKLARFINTLN